MSNQDPFVQRESGDAGWQEPPEIILASVVPEPAAQELARQPGRRRWKLPLALFVATCLSVFLAGAGFPRSFTAKDGLIFVAALMTILVCHEAGHFVQARRHGVYASYPFFLPMPFSPIGTFGAVIAMDSRIQNRKALFDIGIAGPLAGLFPTMLFVVAGLMLSQPASLDRVNPSEPVVGSSLLFRALTQHFVPPSPDMPLVSLHPMAFAGWVGMLITALNLIPIGQLDGGHVLYALLGRRAHAVAFLLLYAAVAAVAIGFYDWSLMVLLLAIMGPRHPPTADDALPVGPTRVVLGWLTLAFLVVGFTPEPFRFL